MLGAKSTGARTFYKRYHYTEGEWVPASTSRPSIADSVPRFCHRSRTACPLGTCSEGAATPAEVCTSSSDTCYGRTLAGVIRGRPAEYTQFTSGLKWVWKPRDDCHFSPLGSASVHGDALSDPWRAWAEGLEADGGPMLWVGDAMLAEHFVAFQSL